MKRAGAFFAGKLTGIKQFNLDKTILSDILNVISTG